MDCTEVSRRDSSLKAKQLRREGVIPAVVFGGALTESISLQINEPVVKKMLTSKRVGSRMDIKLDGETIPVQLKDVTYDPVSRNVQHISFQALKADQKVNSVVDIFLQSTEKMAGILEQQINEIAYSALPKDMIDFVRINIDGQPIGTVVTVGDIKELQNDKIELHVNPDEIVYRIVEKREIEEDTEEESTETEESAE